MSETSQQRDDPPVGEGLDEDASVAERLPVVRIGLFGGTIAMLCCVGPTVLAVLGVVSATTAYAWAETLYGGYTWWFRAAGLLATVGLLGWALRRRRACSVAGARARWRRLLLAVGVAVVTYGALYVVTTALGELGR